MRYAPDEKFKEFIEELSTSNTKEDYKKIRSKEEYKDIFDKYPEFTKAWQYGDNINNTYQYKLFLDKRVSQLQGKPLNILKRLGEKQNISINQIKHYVDTYGELKQEEENKQKISEVEQQKDKEKEEAIAETEQRKDKEKEEAVRNVKAEDNKREQERMAKMKNKYDDERIKKIEEAGKNDNNFNYALKDYLRDNYIIDSPQTREELINKVSTDPKLNAKSDRVINKYVDYILGKQLHRIIMSNNKIIKTAKLFGNDADYLSKLDPIVREAVLKYQTDLINKTIIDKNNKYLLPKKYIKFEKAIHNYKVNPLILRGLYVK